jgi:molybdate/tungstate transport system substrate-binding protein
MGHHRPNPHRRDFLKHGATLFAGVLLTGDPGRLLAEELAMLDVASAGSLRSMLDGPLKTAAAQTLKLQVQSHSMGADAVARSIVDGSLKADVFIPITAGPMLTVMHAGGAQVALPVARTEMVITYSPKSRFAPQFEAAAQGKANWWEVLQQPGLRFVRSDPAGDPGGRNIIFTMMLAAKKYRQPNLVEKVLGPTLNPEQILTGDNNQGRLQNGELDAAGSYRTAPQWSGLPYIVLPKDINLSGQNVRAEYPDVNLTVGGKTFYPEPLVFYAAVLRGAPNAKGAAAFVEWLQGNEGQALFRRYAFDPPGGATAIHA